MNRRKTAAIILDNMDLNFSGLSLEEIGHIFEQLPKDARIVGFGSEFYNQKSCIRIYSDSFKELDDGEQIPEIKVKLVFSETLYGKYFIPSESKIEIPDNLFEGVVHFNGKSLEFIPPVKTESNCNCDMIKKGYPFHAANCSKFK